MVFVIARPRRFRELVGVPINVRALWWTRADGSVVAFSQAVNKVGQIFDARAGSSSTPPARNQSQKRQELQQRRQRWPQ